MVHVAIAVSLLLFSGVSQAQESAPPEGSASKIRVFITDSKSWEISGGFAGGEGVAGGGTRGGARPQTVEIMKTFEQRCPELSITIKQERADFIVLLDHEGGKGGIRRDNKIAVFDKHGDSVFTGSTRSLGNAVKDACYAIRRELRRGR